MLHCFNPILAKEYGIDSAVMLQNIYYWIKTNKANNRNYYDGRYWTYNSIKAFGELFPYWNEGQVRRILDKLESKGAILSGNYNKVAYDRTKWYTLNDDVYAICDGNLLMKTSNPFDENDKSHLMKTSNGTDENIKPIPYINTNNKPDINTDIYKEFEKTILRLYKGTKSKSVRDKKVPKLLKQYSVEELTRCLERYAKECKGREKKYILNESTFWNGRYADYLDCNYAENYKQPQPTRKAKLEDF